MAKKTEIPTVCKKCGSEDVEIKVFVNQKTGYIDYSTYEDEDTWCNVCEDHTGVEDRKKNKKYKK